MQRYIFDCRQKMHECPKFLKRNHKVSKMPIISSLQNISPKTICDYTKNKIFLTFDYSYYQIVPKTASMHVGNRINNLNSLIAYDDKVQQSISPHSFKQTQKQQKMVQNNRQSGYFTEPQQNSMISKFKRLSKNISSSSNNYENKVHKNKHNSNSFIAQYKWRKQKQNIQSGTQLRKNSLHKGKKKIRVPVNSMPGVGDYYYEPKNIQKKIVYDVKLRGKPLIYMKSNLVHTQLQNQTINQQNKHSLSYQNSSNKMKQGQISMNSFSNSLYSDNKMLSHNNSLPRNSKSANGYNANNSSFCSPANVSMNGNISNKQFRSPMRIRQNQEQYNKFINAIDVKNVWKKLMQKHKLKGTKFDVFNHNQ